MLSCVQTFLSSYRRLLVHTAHRRGAPATGGMAANIVTGAAAVEAVTRDKRREIEAGVDGFLIYDLALAAPCRQLWADMEKQLQNLNSKLSFSKVKHDLFQIKTFYLFQMVPCR